MVLPLASSHLPKNSNLICRVQHINYCKQIKTHINAWPGARSQKPEGGTGIPQYPAFPLASEYSLAVVQLILQTKLSA